MNTQAKSATLPAASVAPAQSETEKLVDAALRHAECVRMVKRARMTWEAAASTVDRIKTNEVEPALRRLLRAREELDALVEGREPQSENIKLDTATAAALLGRVGLQIIADTIREPDKRGRAA